LGARVTLTSCTALDAAAARGASPSVQARIAADTFAAARKAATGTSRPNKEWL